MALIALSKCSVLTVGDDGRCVVVVSGVLVSVFSLREVSGEALPCPSCGAHSSVVDGDDPCPGGTE